MKLLFRFVAFCVCAALLGACTYTFNASGPAEEEESVPVGTIKPELDYSSESPDCLTAAKRIKENLVVGMTLGDVKRLVGRPRLIWPGVWWWTDSMSKEGRPFVRYGIVVAEDDVPIVSFSSETREC